MVKCAHHPTAHPTYPNTARPSTHPTNSLPPPPPPRLTLAHFPFHPARDLPATTTECPRCIVMQCGYRIFGNWFQIRTWILKYIEYSICFCTTQASHISNPLKHCRQAADGNPTRNYIRSSAPASKCNPYTPKSQVHLPKDGVINTHSRDYLITTESAGGATIFEESALGAS